MEKGNMPTKEQLMKDLDEARMRIAELEKAHESLLVSEAKYRSLAEKMNDIVWTADMDLNITYDSPSTEKVFGFTLEERLNQKASDMLTPDSYVLALKVLSEELGRDKDEGVDPDRCIRLELEYYHKNGSTVWMECVMSAIRGNSGDIVGIHGVSRDITDRKHAEEALRLSENRFRSIIQKSLDIIIMLDEKGIIKYETPSVESLLGYKAGALISHSPLEFIHPADLKTVEHDLHEVYQKTNPGIPTEFRFRRADGSWVYLEAVGQNLLGDPAVNGIVLTARDISERKRSEEELRKHSDNLEDLVRERTSRLIQANDRLKQEIEERRLAEDVLHMSEEIYRIHFSLSDDAMFTSDEDFRIRSVTPNVERILGYKPRELVGKTFLEVEVLHPDDINAAMDDALNILKGGASHNPVYRFITKDGKIKYGEVSGVPLVKKGSAVMLISVARDVTERMERDRSMLEILDRSRTHFSLTNDVMFTFNHKFMVTSVSPNAEKILGYTPEYIMSKPMYELGIMAPDYMEEAHDNALHLLSGQTILSTIYEFIARDGSRKFGEVSGSALKRDGRVVEVVCVAREITHQMDHERFMHETRATAQALLNACTDFMVLIDETGTILHMNKAASDNLGRNTQDLLGTCIFNHLPSDVAQRRRIYFEQVISSGKPVRFRDERGNKIIQTSLFPVLNINGKVSRIAIYAQDTTKQK